MSKQPQNPPAANDATGDLTPFPLTPEDDTFRARAIRGACGLGELLPDASEAFDLIRHAAFAVAVYPEEDGYGLVVIKGQHLADGVMAGRVSVPWTAIPFADAHAARLVQALLAGGAA